MRILMLADGRSAHTTRYQNKMKALGVEIILASLERGNTVDIHLRKRSISNSLNYFFVNKEIKELVRKIDPDLVNPHFASGYGFSTAVSGVWRRKPVALHCLGSDILISPGKSIAHRRKVIYALEKADLIFADSQYLSENINKLQGKSNVEVVPWGVEEEVLTLHKNIDGEGIKRGKQLKVLVPRPHQKIYNNNFIIKSLAELINNGSISLAFPAWGDDFEDFKKDASRLCPRAEIIFYPFMPRKEYFEFLRQFDIYLSASLSDSSPASLIEAMGAGLFPIVGEIPGVMEWMDNERGLFFDPSDNQTLKLAFEKLQADDLDIKKILESNHQKVKVGGLFENNIQQTLNLLEGILKRGN